MNRNHRKQLGIEAVEITRRGWYEGPDGTRVDLSAAIDRCLKQTRLYTPEDLDEWGLPRSNDQTNPTVFEVNNETTLAAATRIIGAEEPGKGECLALNFASAKNPGGGFLSGSQAQEESLARSSALYASLITQNRYYDANRACQTSLYTDHLILSPAVPVFRNDQGNLLSRPYCVSVLTSPAVNAGAVRKNEPHNVGAIHSTMVARISSVLSVAADQGYEHLVLGAWGCGVFQNEPTDVARWFADALLAGGPFANQFASVTFAVLDSTPDRKIIEPFENLFPTISQG